MKSLRYLLAGSLLIGLSCAPRRPAIVLPGELSLRQAPKTSVAPNPSAATDKPDHATPAASSTPVIPTPELLPTDPKARDFAEALFNDALGLYKKGQYQQAEQLLTDSISQFPFLPGANVLLGKILLLRGSTARDATLIEAARLMFQMARATEPLHKEANLLLELFRDPHKEPKL